MNYGLIKVVKAEGPRYENKVVHATNVREFADAMWLASIEMRKNFLGGWRPDLILFLNQEEIDNSLEYFAEKPRARYFQDVTKFPTWDAWSVRPYDFLAVATLKWEIDAVLHSATFNGRYIMKNHDLFSWDRWLMMNKVNYADGWREKT